MYSLIEDYRLKKLHENYFSSLNEREGNLSAKLEKLKKESASSVADVRMEIICRYISKELWSVVNFARDQYGGRQGDGNSTPESLYKSEGGFVKFFNSNHPVYIGYYEQSYNRYHYSQIEAGNIIDEYEKRARLVSSDRMQEYKKNAIQLEEVKEEIRTRNSITLANLTTLIGKKKFRGIAEQYIEQCKSPDFLDSKQLETVSTGFLRGGFEVLYYLLTNGYIMQDYMRFRSIFHEGAISVNDNDYIKAVGRFIGCNDVNDNFSLDNEKMCFQNWSTRITFTGEEPFIISLWLI